VKKREIRFDEKGLKAFGIHLKKLRKEKGFTQERLADISNVAESLIQKMEYGSTNATLSTLLALSRGLKVSMKELCDFKVPSEK
jgi:transcriptional regulator with XRE-family HTH domain